MTDTESEDGRNPINATAPSAPVRWLAGLGWKIFLILSLVLYSACAINALGAFAGFWKAFDPMSAPAESLFLYGFAAYGVFSLLRKLGRAH